MPRVGVAVGVVVVAATVLLVVTEDEVGLDEIVLDADELVVETDVLAEVVEELHAGKGTPSATIRTRTFSVRLTFTPQFHAFRFQ